MAQAAPRTLGTRGKKLWREVTKDHALDAQQGILLEEACRTADRLEKLDEKLRGDDDAWARIVVRPEFDDEDSRVIELRIDGALSEARQQQNILKQLLAAMRLEDLATGKKPQARGGGRGSYAPRASAPKVVSLADRFGA